MAGPDAGEHSRDSITISARPESIMCVISDFLRYPEWAEGIVAAEVLRTDRGGRGTLVEFRLESSVLTDVYRLAYQWAPDGRSVSWHLVSGSMQRWQEGSYRLVEDGGHTTVTYELAVQLEVPIIGKLQRKAERVILDTALKALKLRVEQGPEASAEAGGTNGGAG